MDPGATVLVNADNDAGSQTVDGANGHFPLTRDRELGPSDPIERRRNEDDLRRVSLTLPQPGPNEQRSVRLRWTETGAPDRTLIKLWLSREKNEANIGITTWPLAQAPKTIWVEGVNPSNLRRQIEMKLELLDGGGAVLKSDRALWTVTPVLEDLHVAAGQGTAPFLGFDVPRQQWVLASSGGVPAAGALYAKAFALRSSGALRLMQTVRDTNNLNGAGARFSNNAPAKSYDFAAPLTGQRLLDSGVAAPFKNDPPLYTVDEQKSFVIGTARADVLATDSPRLWNINAVLPPAGATTDVDVTMLFDAYAVWQFNDRNHSIYTLGGTAWNVRYQGTLFIGPIGPGFAPGANNANNGSTGFNTDNSDPWPLTAPYANDGGSDWR
jgi:hypothetical protein